MLDAHLARGAGAALRDLRDVLEADAWARARGARVARREAGRSGVSIFQTAFEFVFAFVLLLSHPDLRARARTLPGGARLRRARAQVLDRLRAADRHRAASGSRWKRGGTEYVIAWFPLGGFVKMLGENPDEVDDPEALAHPDEALGAKPLWQKLAIVFAGPVMNLLLPVRDLHGDARDRHAAAGGRDRQRRAGLARRARRARRRATA